MKYFALLFLSLFLIIPSSFSAVVRTGGGGGSGGASSQWDDVTGGINYAGGNVGIATTLPSAKLEIGGIGNAVTDNYGLLVRPKTAGTNNWNIYSGTDVANLFMTYFDYARYSDNVLSSYNNGKSGFAPIAQDNSGNDVFGVLGAAISTAPSGTVSAVVGIEQDAINAGNANVTTLVGQTQNVANAGAGVVDEGIGMLALPVQNTGAGSVTKAYGIKAENQTVGSAYNWNIYSGNPISDFNPVTFDVTTLSSQNVFASVNSAGHYATGGFLSQSNDPTSVTAAISYADSTAANPSSVLGHELLGTFSGSGTAVRVASAGTFVGNGGPGIIADAVGLIVFHNSSYGGGSITRNTGVLVEDQTEGGTNYAFRTGLGKVYFGDNVGIGTDMTSATGRLVVIGGNVGIGTIIPQGALTVMSGNVGIGTWKPSALLQVSKDATDGTVMQVGTGANTQSSINFQSTRAMVGYDGGNVNLQGGIGKGASMSVNSGVFGSGTLLIIAAGSGDRSALSGNSITNTTTLAGATLVAAGNNVGIGTINPIGSRLIVNGMVSIGTANSSYVTTAAPSGGLIVEGNVGIGSLTPGSGLDIASVKTRLTQNSHFITTAITAPTVANNDCGTTSQGTIVAKSSDNSGTVTVGTLAVTSCAVTFATAWTNAPNCIVIDDTSILTVRPGTISTTKLTINSTTSMSGDNVTWICNGNE